MRAILWFVSTACLALPTLNAQQDPETAVGKQVERALDRARELRARGDTVRADQIVEALERALSRTAPRAGGTQPPGAGVGARADRVAGRGRSDSARASAGTAGQATRVSGGGRGASRSGYAGATTADAIPPGAGRGAQRAGGQAQGYRRGRAGAGAAQAPTYARGGISDRPARSITGVGGVAQGDGVAVAPMRAGGTRPADDTAASEVSREARIEALEREMEELLRAVRALRREIRSGGRR